MHLLLFEGLLELEGPGNEPDAEEEPGKAVQPWHFPVIRNKLQAWHRLLK